MSSGPAFARSRARHSLQRRRPLSVEQVSYGYSANPSQASLHAGSHQLSASPAKVVAILGPNASGKSTLLKLIPGPRASFRPNSSHGFVPIRSTPEPRTAYCRCPAGESLALPSARLGFVLQGRHAHGRSLRFEWMTMS